MSKSGLRFPSDRLRPSGGEIFAHLWENDFTGLKPTLFWSVHIDFEPFKYREFELQCNFMVDWIELNVRDWRSLDGKAIKNKGEPTFYTLAHDWAKSYSLALRMRRDKKFAVSLNAKIDFPGFDKDDQNDRLPVACETILPFSGLLVGSSFATKFQGSNRGLRAYLDRFVDMDAFGSIVKSRKQGPFTSGPWLLP